MEFKRLLHLVQFDIFDSTMRAVNTSWAKDKAGHSRTGKLARIASKRNTAQFRVQSQFPQHAGGHLRHSGIGGRVKRLIYQ
jgi:hypothetical protein